MFLLERKINKLKEGLPYADSPFARAADEAEIKALSERLRTDRYRVIDMHDTLDIVDRTTAQVVARAHRYFETEAQLHADQLNAQDKLAAEVAQLRAWQSA